MSDARTARAAYLEHDRALARAELENGGLLMRRTLAEQGLAPGALMIPAAEVLHLTRRAVEVGRRLETAELGDVRCCRACGCTELSPCEGGCGWAERDLCTACAVEGAPAEGMVPWLADVMARSGCGLGLIRAGMATAFDAAAAVVREHPGPGGEVAADVAGVFDTLAEGARRGR